MHLSARAAKGRLIGVVFLAVGVDEQSGKEETHIAFANDVFRAPLRHRGDRTTQPFRRLYL